VGYYFMVRRKEMSNVVSKRYEECLQFIYPTIPMSTSISMPMQRNNQWSDETVQLSCLFVEFDQVKLFLKEKKTKQ
jgi:hypothetical protein